MNVKNVILMMILLVAVLTVGAVGAADVNSTSDGLEIDQDLETQTFSNGADELISDNENDATFSDLSGLLENASENSVLELTKDYRNYGQDDISGILISKSLTIDGKGHTINADNKSGIFMFYVDNIAIKNVVFKNAHHSGDMGAGAVYCLGNNCTLTDCSFINCYSNLGGGAVCIYGSDGFTLNGCRFINCSVGSGSCAIEWSGNNGIISDCIFMNFPKDRFCSIFLKGDNNSMSDCDFINCSSPSSWTVSWNGDGGRIYDCSFRDCEAALYLDGINGSICNCIFTNSSFNFPNPPFDNLANPVIAVNSDNVSVSNCSFNNCSSWMGGAISWRGDNGTISDSSFMNCRAGYGGAIYFENAVMDGVKYNCDNCVVENCSFVNCSAVWSGGAVCVYRGTEYVGKKSYSAYWENSSIINCNFTDCSSGCGGAIHMQGCPNNVVGSAFINCSSRKMGGAISIDSSSSGNSGIVNCTFISLVSGGGYAFYADSPFSLTDSTFINCTYFIQPTIVADNMTVLYSSGEVYHIRIYEDNGVLSKHAEVDIALNGKTFKSLEAGKAEFKITQKPGKYTLTISSLGKTETRTLTVKHIVKLGKVTVKRSAKKLVLSATLRKVNGAYLKDKQITFVFNGKKYTAKTDARGVAKLTVKSKVLKKLKAGKKVTYQATYLKDTVKKTVTVKK